MQSLTAMGIDVSASRGMDVVLLDQYLHPTCWSRQTVQDIKGLLGRHHPMTVGIDAPPSFPTVGNKRKCEGQLNALGLRVFYSPSSPAQQAHPFYDWMRIGHQVFQAAREAGYPTYLGQGGIRGSAFEVYPHATAILLHGSLPPSGWAKSAFQKRGWRTAVLQRVGVPTNGLVTMDLVDAALAALTARLALDDRIIVLGPPGEEALIIPKPPPEWAYRLQSGAFDPLAAAPMSRPG